ncbi:phage protein [Pseudomonas phage PA02]|nr:phage protein [Pseudomonas phage PA02]
MSNETNYLGYEWKTDITTSNLNRVVDLYTLELTWLKEDFNDTLFIKSYKVLEGLLEEPSRAIHDDTVTVQDQLDELNTVFKLVFGKDNDVELSINNDSIIVIGATDTTKEKLEAEVREFAYRKSLIDERYPDIVTD